MKKWSLFMETATVAVNNQSESTSQAAAYPGCGSSGCGSSAAGSSCCGSGTPQSQAQIERIQTRLYGFHAKELGDSSINVDVHNLGCHQGAKVTEAGIVIRRFSINGREIDNVPA